MDRGLGDGAGAVEAQVHELELLGRRCRRPAAAARASVSRISSLILSTSSVSGCPAVLTCRNFCTSLVDCRAILSASMPKSSIELGHEIGEAPGVVIEDGDVAAGHVGDVDLVPLLDQADDRAAHADDVVVRMRAEDESRSFADL